ncbi:hypothetical protein EDB80DRAFT_342866 [Ilyonectria destructans]|nr:hypothetical protein EDB80DRAFT_342866 [Ilyonectria destructans]
MKASASDSLARLVNASGFHLKQLVTPRPCRLPNPHQRVGLGHGRGLQLFVPVFVLGQETHERLAPGGSWRERLLYCVRRALEKPTFVHRIHQKHADADLAMYCTRTQGLGLKIHPLARRVQSLARLSRSRLMWLVNLGYTASDMQHLPTTGRLPWGDSVGCQGYGRAAPVKTLILHASFCERMRQSCQNPAPRQADHVESPPWGWAASPPSTHSATREL